MSSSKSREQRIRREIELLERLKRGSAIFDFHLTGDSPDLIPVTFNGKGVVARWEEGLAEESGARTDSNVKATEIEPVIEDVHRIQIRLPEDFPVKAPEIRWQSGLLHPNVSFSGFVDFDELGLPWQPEMTLDVVCDRLWDVNRLAWVNLPAATNHMAKRWFEKDCAFALPVDARPLRNRALAHPQNIVSYRRIGKPEPPPLAPKTDLMFIGDEEKAVGSQEASKRRSQASTRPRTQTSARKVPDAEIEVDPVNDDGIFFIN